MLERLLKYWPIIVAAALVIVSVFNIGYFTTIGLHFVGVMDLSNIVYAVALVFGLLIIPMMFIPDNLISAFNVLAQFPNAAVILNKAMKVFTLAICALFTAGLFVHQPYISITGLFAVTFLVGLIAYSIYAYLMYLHTKAIPVRIIVSGLAFGLFTIFWIGAAVGYHEAFGTTSLYLVMAKGTVYEKVRLVRSSSSGFLITQGKKVIYIPSGEIKSVIAIDPVDNNP